jgi:hypothetical protein
VKFPFAVNLRVPERRSTVQGKSGPKDNPRGEADGKPVKIPAPAHNKSDGWAR